MAKKKEYSGDLMTIVLQVPSNTVRLSFVATTFSDDEKEQLVKTKRVMSIKDIMEARNDYLSIDPYDDLYGVYTIAPEFKEFYEKGTAAGKTCEEISMEWNRHKKEEC